MTEDKTNQEVIPVEDFSSELELLPTAVEAMDNATKNAPATKEEAIAKARFYGQQSGKGFRKNHTGSRFKGQKMSKADKVRANAWYQENVDKFYDLGLEALEAMIIDDEVIENGNKVTGSAIYAFQDAYRSLMQEKAMADMQVIKAKQAEAGDVEEVTPEEEVVSEDTTAD